MDIYLVLSIALIVLAFALTVSARGRWHWKGQDECGPREVPVGEAPPCGLASDAVVTTSRRSQCMGSDAQPDWIEGEVIRAGWLSEADGISALEMQQIETRRRTGAKINHS